MSAGKPSHLAALATRSCVSCGKPVTIYPPEDGWDPVVTCGRCAGSPVSIVGGTRDDRDPLGDTLAEDLLRAKICTAPCMLALEVDCHCRCGGEFPGSLLGAMVKSRLARV